MIPITRIDEYLAVISQDEDATGLPDQAVTRIDMYLSKIAGEAVAELPEPVTRIDRYLASIAGMDVVMDDPITRIDYYLATVAGVYSGELPEPVTRIDYYLYQWAQGGGDLPWTTFVGNPLQFTAPRAHTLRSTTVTFAPKQSGSGDPSPDNVRPISGWDSVSVWGAGENLIHATEYHGSCYNRGTGYNLAVTSYQTITTAENGNEITVYSELGFGGWIYSTEMLPAGDYYFHIVTEDANARITAYTADNDYVTTGIIANIASATTINKAVTLTEFSRILVGIGVNSSGNSTTVEDMQVEVGSAYTEWSPYTGSTTTVTFPSTVYGGSDEVVGGNGESTWGKFTLDGTIADADFGLTVLANYTQIAYVPFVAVGKGDGRFICNIFPYVTSGFAEGKCWNNRSASSPRMFFGLPTTVTTKAEARAWFTDNPTEICYELATPTSFTTTPTPIDAVQGINTMWTDGDTLTVEARGEAVNLSALQSLNMLLGGRYYNNGTQDEPTDEEALNIILGGNER